MQPVFVPMAELEAEQRRAVAQLLVDAFVGWPESWETLDAAQQEVADSLVADRISLVALDGAHQVVGWIGAISSYHGRVWELHPLAVRPDLQGHGIGRALVQRLEDEVRKRGGLTIYLGSDDVTNMTSLGGVDLYPRAVDKLAHIENLRRHPIGFYQRIGYEIVGVVPDANGFGKPDIMLAKRVDRTPTA